MSLNYFIPALAVITLLAGTPSKGATFIEGTDTPFTRACSLKVVNMDPIGQSIVVGRFWIDGAMSMKGDSRQTTYRLDRKESPYNSAGQIYRVYKAIRNNKIKTTTTKFYVASWMPFDAGAIVAVERSEHYKAHTLKYSDVTFTAKCLISPER